MANRTEIKCCKCENKAYIKYGNEQLCSKHYTLAINDVFKQTIKEGVTE